MSLRWGTSTTGNYYRAARVRDKVGPKAYAKKRVSKMRMLRPVRPVLADHKFERTASYQLLTTTYYGLADATAQLNALTFALSAAPTGYGPGMGIYCSLSQFSIKWTNGSSTNILFPNTADFSTLFDQYKLDWFKVRFVGTNTQSIVGAGGSSVGPIAGGVSVQHCLDYDDNSAPALNELTQRPECGFTSLLTPYGKKEFFVNSPCYETVVNQNGTSQFGKISRGFIDMSDTIVPHYGIKFYQDQPFSLGASPGSCTGFVQMYVTYGVTCRGVR